MNPQVLVATSDRRLQRALESKLATHGIDVFAAASNLSMVWRLTGGEKARPSVIVLDARRNGLGPDPLDWLRDDAFGSALIVLADSDDRATRAKAELVEAAALMVDDTSSNNIVREVCRILRGDSRRQLLSWVPPRAAPRIAAHNQTYKWIERSAA